MTIGTNQIDFDISRCSYGEKLKTGGVCETCSDKNCSICPASKPDFTGVCRVCNTSVVNSTCVSTKECPADYYNSNGICYRCPVGCS